MFLWRATLLNWVLTPYSDCDIDLVRVKWAAWGDTFQEAGRGAEKGV